MLGLEKQIHVYSLDTASFYNQNELTIHNKLLRLYHLRNKIKEIDPQSFVIITSTSEIIGRGFRNV